MDEQSAGIRRRRLDGIGVATMAPLRGRTADLAARLGEGFGITLPPAARWIAAEALGLIAVGPGRWLVLREAAEPDFAAALAARFAGIAAITDQSDAQIIVDLDGERVHDLLAKGLNLDLHPAAFPPDGAVVTIIGQIPVVLWRVDPAPVYRLALPRSWYGSFGHWLAASAAEFGLLNLPEESRVACDLRPAASRAADLGRSSG